MTQRRKWTAIPGLLALAVGAIALSAYSGASSPQGNGPAQPIAFPHPVHVKQVGMNCVYCHYSAYKSPDPGMPAVSTCMGCHAAVGPQRPAIAGVRDKPVKSEEIQKLWQFADYGPGSTNGAKAKPIPWVRIHKVPEYVRFPHMRHVSAGVTCQSCHGAIQNMERVSQQASLNMGWCINCHVNGYDPKAGLAAAGYSSTDGAAAASPTADGFLVKQAHAQTGQPTGGAGLPADPSRSSAPSQGAPGQTAGSYLAGGSYKNGKRLARYDCANCHY